MTARDEAFRTAVVDGGALGAAAIDVATRTVNAGYAHENIATPALLDLLLGTVRPSGPLTLACGGPPLSAARELFVAGKDRALYCTMLTSGELLIVATPVTTSIALGWTLVRMLSGAKGEPR